MIIGRFNGCRNQNIAVGLKAYDDKDQTENFIRKIASGIKREILQQIIIIICMHNQSWKFFHFQAEVQFLLLVSLN